MEQGARRHREQEFGQQNDRGEGVEKDKGNRGGLTAGRDPRESRLQPVRRRGAAIALLGG